MAPKLNTRYGSFFLVHLIYSELVVCARSDVWTPPPYLSRLVSTKQKESIQ